MTTTELDTIYRDYSYELYEFMFKLKVEFKRCTELHKCNYTHFDNTIRVQPVEFIHRVHTVFIESIGSIRDNEIIERLFKNLVELEKKNKKDTIEYFVSKNEYFTALGLAFIEVFEKEYAYHCESYPTLMTGTLFLQYPKLSHKNLFYKKIKPEKYKEYFDHTPPYRRMDLLAHYVI